MEKDYKKLYLEQRKQSLMLEMSLMQVRADAINAELPEVEAELKAYADKNEKTGKDKA